MSGQQPTGEKSLEDALKKANESIGKMDSLSGGIIISPGVRGTYIPLTAVGSSGDSPRIPNMPTGVGSLSSGGSSPGFRPLGLIEPTKGNSSSGPLGSKLGALNSGGYKYYDWTGQRIEKRDGISNDASKLNFLDTEERFNISKDLPKSDKQLKTSPYSIRDIYSIFNDKKTDYFKHGLQSIYSLNPIVPSDYWETSQNGSVGMDTYKGTPFENQDPVMFGFDIIIDNVSSPLLNGAVSGFIQNYKSVNEIYSKRTVYEDFRNQFIKFFRTRASLKPEIDTNNVRLTSLGDLSPNLDGPSKIYNPGKNAYLGFYLNGIKGLDKLIEINTPTTKKYITEYGKDFITLDFTEDVSLSIGTLAHLYKLLYWSKPQGKGLVPENLLRFNCEIVISECRNFNRVRKAAQTGNLEIIKDNVSRYVYSLRECQFYFDKMPHDDTIDMSNIKTYDRYQVSFDYKYSSVRLEKFTPTGGGFGVYQGYNSGAMWKIGNPGSRDQRKNPDDISKDSSIPKFYTIGQNPFLENGIINSTTKKPEPFIIQKIGNEKNLSVNEKTPENSSESVSDPTKGTSEEPGKPASVLEDQKKSSKENRKKALEKAKNSIIDAGKNLKDKFTDPNVIKGFLKNFANVAVAAAKQSIDRQFTDAKAIRQQLLMETLNKIKNSTGLGSEGNIYLNDGDRSRNAFPKHMPKNPLYNPPRNIYTDDPIGSGFGISRVFYDVRGSLLNFLGDGFGGLFGGNGTRV